MAPKPVVLMSRPIATLVMGTCIALVLRTESILLADRAPTPPRIQMVIRQSPDHQEPYARLMAGLSKASQTNRFQLSTAGYSVKGRPIPLVVIAPAKSSRLPDTRVMILCGQHGDEPASPLAALGLIRKCANGMKPELLLSDHARGLADPSINLSNILWIIMPVVNPDGYNQGSRLNAARADLNRDWVKATQPETRVARQIFNTWKPHVVLDLHQWSPDDPPPASNGMEMVLRPSAPFQQTQQRQLAISVLRSVNSPMRAATLVTSRSGSDTSLAHRYFATQKAGSFLVETSANSSNRDRISLLTDIIILVSSELSKMPANTKNVAFASAKGFSYPSSFKQWYFGLDDSMHNASLRGAKAQLFGIICTLCLALFGLSQSKFSRRPAWAWQHRFLRVKNTMRASAVQG